MKQKKSEIPKAAGTGPTRAMPQHLDEIVSLSWASYNSSAFSLHAAAEKPLPTLAAMSRHLSFS